MNSDDPFDIEKYDLLREATIAERRIRNYVNLTPLQRSLPLSKIADCNVLLKLECLQHTGSFKIRGAMNKLLSLSPGQLKKGVVTASTGNHGLAVSYGADSLDARCVVFVPETVSQKKRDAIEALGARTMVHGADNCMAQIAAREFAASKEMVFIAPYNDPDVVAGQGSIGVEIIRQCREKNFDAIFICLGGGGLISGISGYLKNVMPGIRVYGCSPANSAGMIESINAGRIVEIETKTTLSDGSAGGSVVPGSITYDLCRKYVDDFDTVTEDEIRKALLWFLDTHHLLIEGSAAVPIATLIRKKAQLKGKNVIVLLCGANITLETLSSILANLSRQ